MCAVVSTLSVYFKLFSLSLLRLAVKSHRSFIASLHRRRLAVFHTLFSPKRHKLLIVEADDVKKSAWQPNANLTGNFLDKALIIYFFRGDFFFVPSLISKAHISPCAVARINAL